MAEPIKVFVSSDMVELENEREIAETTIRKLSFRALLFELLPALSRSPVAAYIEKVQQCDIFVMILWRELPRAVEQEHDEAVARAKPVLTFLKNLEEGEKRSTELSDFLTDLRVRKTYRTFRKLDDLSKSLQQALSEEIAKFYETPRITTTRNELYDLGTDIIRNAQKRLYVVQRTPALFLGAREYLAPEKEKKHFEKRFVDELTKWIKIAEKDDKKTLLYLFSPTATHAELDSIKKESPKGGRPLSAEVSKRITNYKDVERESGERLRFLPLRHPFSGPMAVGDNRFAIWILGKDSAVSLSQENDALATHLAQQLEQHVEENVETKTILKELGLAAPSHR